jgi:hypothetical protein
MKKLMKNIAVILGLCLIGLTTTNAQNTKLRAPGEICYVFNSQGMLGDWKDELLVSKKKLTYKQAAAYMQKNHNMSEIYDVEELPTDECEAAIPSYSFEPGFLFYHKEPKAAKAQTVKKAAVK